MPTYEHAALLQQKDQNGNLHINYPITKAENVDGIYESPTLTGIPTAPTAENGTNTNQIATTKFVQTAISGLGGSSGGGTETVNSHTVFAEDGNVETTYENGKSVSTVFNSDGSVTETSYLNGTAKKKKRTVFNEDGSVSTTYTTGGD